MQNDTTARPSVVVWFEIPVANLERAVHFYDAALGVELRREQFGPDAIAIFPYERPAISGCLQQVAGHRGDGQGARIFLNCDGKLDAVLDRIVQAGGAVTAEKTALPPGMGWVAEMRDLDGNRIGLHAMF